jgi:hypothetical protein
MIRNRAHYYSNKFGVEYLDLEEEGFFIYCMTLVRFNPEKASFSTYLWQNLSGRLSLYCRQKIAIEGLDNFDEPFEKFIDLWEAKESPSVEQFLQYAYDYLSPVAYNILLWILDNQLIESRSKKNPSLIKIAKMFNMSLEMLKTYWQELFDFWNMRGFAFYSVK